MTVSLVACLCLDKVNVTLRTRSCGWLQQPLEKKDLAGSLAAWLLLLPSFLLSLGHLVEVGFDVQFAVCAPPGLILEELGT